MPFNEIGIKKIAGPVIILISILFLTSGILSGCAYKREALTKTFALKLIRQKIKFSPFFAVPYSKAVSIDNDHFYSLLLKNKYIRFNRKLGYTAFMPKLKPFLFKKADRTYIRMGTFDIKIINLKFISKKLADASFSFIFKPNILYGLAKKNNIKLIRFDSIIKAKRASVIFKYKPFLEWEPVKWKHYKTI